MSKHRGTDPETLAARLRAGSAEAVGEIRAHIRKILAFRGYRIPAEDRRDLEQEVMTQVWQAVNRTGFDPALGFAKFVEVVATRRAIDWLRARRPESELTADLDAGDSPERDAVAAERTRLAREALARLDKPCRDLVYLRVGMNRSYRELAGILGRSEGALRVQMHRCIRRMRRLLEERRGGAGASGEGQRS